MFRIRFYRDITNPDPKKRRKIRGIIFFIGRSCSSACYCDKSNKCRYRDRHQVHNLSVRFRSYIYRKCKIKIPYFIYFDKWVTNLSGTKKCPFHKSRRYSCWECKNSYGLEYCRFEWNVRSESSNEDWPHSVCGLFEPEEYAKNWDKRTGEYIERIDRK